MSKYFRMSCLSSLATLFLFVAGCNNNSSVTGTVTFPDGKPLTKGTVVFESPKSVAKGDLDGSGHYKLGGAKKGDGVPVGLYKVYVTGAGGVPEGFVPPPDEDVSGYVSLIDDKYASPGTSPLKLEVTQSCSYDFTVEPPKETKPQ